MRWIVFSAVPAGQHTDQLFRIQSTGEGLQQITKGGYPSVAPAFSPDGKRIAFARTGVGIVTMNVDGTGIRRLTTNGRDGFPAWSPDGKTHRLRPARTTLRGRSTSCPRPAPGSGRLPKAPPSGTADLDRRRAPDPLRRRLPEDRPDHRTHPQVLRRHDRRRLGHELRRALAESARRSPTSARETRSRETRSAARARASGSRSTRRTSSRASSRSGSPRTPGRRRSRRTGRSWSSSPTAAFCSGRSPTTSRSRSRPGMPTPPWRLLLRGSRNPRDLR